MCGAALEWGPWRNAILQRWVMPADARWWQVIFQHCMLWQKWTNTTFKIALYAKSQKWPMVNDCSWTCSHKSHRMFRNGPESLCSGLPAAPAACPSDHCSSSSHSSTSRQGKEEVWTVSGGRRFPSWYLIIFHHFPKFSLLICKSSPLHLMKNMYHLKIPNHSQAPESHKWHLWIKPRRMRGCCCWHCGYWPCCYHWCHGCHWCRWCLCPDRNVRRDLCAMCRRLARGPRRPWLPVGWGWWGWHGSARNPKKTAFKQP